jgi:hypothetical protein
MTRTILMLCVAAFFCLSGSTAHAQRDRYDRRYEPSRPTLSPYLNYFRQDTGLVDSYNTFVRPQERLRREMNRQESRLRNLDRQVGQLDRQVEQQIRPAQMAPTGTGSTFMNYLHYYNLGNRRR